MRPPWVGRVVGCALAYSIWFRGIGKLPVAATSVLTLIAPIVAAVIGFVALDQTLTPLQLVGVAVILSAVTITQWSAARRASVAGDPRGSPVGGTELRRSR